MIKFKMYSVILTLVITLGSSFNISAENVIGCHINGADYLYDTSIGRIEWYVNDYYKPKYPTYNQATKADFKNEWYNPNACPRFGSVNTGGENCAIQGITRVIVDPNNSGNNKLVGLGDTYSYELIYPTCNRPTANLPLGDYIWVLILVAGLYSFRLHSNKRVINN